MRVCNFMTLQLLLFQKQCLIEDRKYKNTWQSQTIHTDKYIPAKKRNKTKIDEEMKQSNSTSGSRLFRTTSVNEPTHDKTNKMTASAQSDQSSLCTQWVAKAFFIWIAKTLIRLGASPGWSESWLGAHAILLVLSRGGSNVLKLANDRYHLDSGLFFFSSSSSSSFLS